MTETTEQAPIRNDDEDPLGSVGNGGFFFAGLIFGFLAAAAIGIVALMALDPLGPGQRTAADPDNDYAAVSAAPAWRALETLRHIDFSDATKRICETVYESP